ncbi:MAG: flagellar hook-length control protein FliK [Desulfobulbaceae bacterium]|jgi:flagellar hook-length control protein FliK|nr:flagellar hook-length control protein FliK [Desulfobulbaceae bacterium]
MPQTIAPAAAAPMTPPNLTAHSQSATKADGDFATVFHFQAQANETPSARPRDTAVGNKTDALASKEQHINKTEADAGTNTDQATAALVELQQAVVAAPELDASISNTSGAINPSEAAAKALAGLKQTLDFMATSTAFQAATNQSANGALAANNKSPDLSALSELLPRLTESASVTGLETAPPQTATRQGSSLLMSELRGLVESHDARATVSFERGAQATLNDMPTANVQESGAATLAASGKQTSVISAAEKAAVTPALNTVQAMIAPSVSGESNRQEARGRIHGQNQTASRNPGLDTTDAATALASARQSAETANDGDSSSMSGNQADKGAANSGGVISGAASNETSAFHQVTPNGSVGAVAAASSASATAKPGQILTADTAVMQQVIDHIRDLPRPLSNRISLQLHPAELGDLKINLTMKEGVIRASVVTQTVQAQEILEKHMPKLRALLAGQGLTLDEVRIGQDGIPYTDPSMFDQGQSSRRGGDSAAQGRRATSGENGASGFAQALEQVTNELSINA